MIVTLVENERHELDPYMEWLRGVVLVKSKTSIAVAIILAAKLQTYPGVEYMPFSPAMVEETGAHRGNVYRALRVLEDAGFVTVRRCRGMSPRVAIRFD